ncbi:DUF4259 domain-containing protein [Actinoplanes derwentensis]|uniref:DUF4259 domain-containing protein n=1 Tax=Actinoplanes derwentensis TaxID=113562 RepID=UPI000B887381|nr:DUF4259 domain-containing protein [Actinoplanes derwentensis]GID83338.1 hypothetical protein Ade03nite_22620 [Actinoplanes derwentensis]
MLGTWNPGPFGNDSAADLLDLAASEEPGARAEFIREMLDEGLRLAAGESVDLFPEDVVAAANLVAISVPGGLERLVEEQETGRFIKSMIPGVDQTLVALALKSLFAMAVPGNDWYDTWFDSDDPEPEAVDAFRAAVEVLQGFH